MSVRAFTVSGLNTYIKDMIADEVYLENILLSGEMSSLSISGVNAYFNLSDSNASINCIFFRCAVKNLVKPEAEFDFKNGDVVQVTGSLSFYVKTGKLSFIVTSCSLKGLGSKQLELERIKKQLLADGVFDKKRAMPKRINHIAVVTSGDGAVIHDICNVATRRNRGVDITLVPVRVQGVGAEQEIAKAIEEINRVAAVLDISLIIIARGGGSEDDLSPFNTEVVARAVFSSDVVTVSAVGHEVNYTLCDFAADFRAPTPSAAAEIAIPLLSDLYAEVQLLQARINTAMQCKLQNNRDFLSQLTKRICLGAERKNAQARRYVELYSNKINALAGRVVEQKRSQLGLLCKRLCSASGALVQTRRNELEVVRAKVSALNPTSLLTAGYAKVLRAKKGVGGVGELDVGSRIDIYMSDGSLSAQVLDIRRLK